MKVVFRAEEGYFIIDAGKTVIGPIKSLDEAYEKLEELSSSDKPKKKGKKKKDESG